MKIDENWWNVQICRICQAWLKLTVETKSEVFAIGDCAVSGKPPTAQVAYQQGLVGSCWILLGYSIVFAIVFAILYPYYLYYLYLYYFYYPYQWVPQCFAPPSSYMIYVISAISIGFAWFCYLRVFCFLAVFSALFLVKPLKAREHMAGGKYLGRTFRLGREYQISDPQAAPFKYCGEPRHCGRGWNHRCWNSGWKPKAITRRI